MMQRRTEMNSFPTYRPPASFRLAVAMAIVMGLSITWGTTPTLGEALRRWWGWRNPLD